MPDTAKEVREAGVGALVYAKDLPQLVAFYRAVLQAQTLQHEADHAVLQVSGLELVIHAIPAAIARTITITRPPQPREEQAIKLFFTVDRLARAREAAAVHGGSVDARTWSAPGFIACNAVDPEGNVIQLREVTRAA